MLTFFGSASTKLTDDQISAYVDAVEDTSLDAVQRSCKQFRGGRVERNNAFVPTPVELAINARQWDTTIATITASQELRKLERIVPYKIGERPPPPSEALGPIKIEVNGISRDVSHLTLTEKELVLRTGQMPQPEAEQIEGRKIPIPQLKRV